MTDLEFKTHLIRNIEIRLKDEVVSDSMPPQGMSSQVFFIIMKSGNQYAVKYGKSAAKDVPAIDLIISSNIEIPVPKVIANFVFNEVPVVILQKIEYPLLEKVPDNRIHEYIPSIIENLKKLHQIKSSKSTLVANPDSMISWKDQMLNIFNGVDFDWNEVSKRDSLVGNLVLRSVENVLAKIKSQAFKVDSFSLLHTDFNQRNLFVDLNNNQITGIIDWEDAVFGDPIFDFARVRMYMWHFGLSDKAVADYYSLMNYSKEESELENLYWLIRVVQYLAWYSEDLSDFSIGRIKLHQDFLREYKWQ